MARPGGDLARRKIEPVTPFYPRSVLRSLVLIAMVASRAVAGPPPVAAPYEHPPSGLGLDLVAGWAGQRNGPSGHVFRLEYEVLPVLAPSREVGPLFGFHAGFEHWRSGDDNWGISLPMTMALGLRVFPVRIVGGVGIDTFVVDQVADDTGFGLFCPLAMARVGLDIFGAQVGVDARATYHWQFGAEDHARWQLGVFIGGTMESGRRGGRPRY